MLNRSYDQVKRIPGRPESSTLLLSAGPVGHSQMGPVMPNQPDPTVREMLVAKIDELVGMTSRDLDEIRP
jgi:hypothetical protein